MNEPLTAARHLDGEPLSQEEIEMLAEGYPPSVLGGLDAEEVITHLSARLLEKLKEDDDREFYESMLENNGGDL